MDLFSPINAKLIEIARSKDLNTFAQKPEAIVMVRIF